MFEFIKLRYVTGKMTAAQVRSLVPVRITQSECDEILAAVTK